MSKNFVLVVQVTTSGWSRFSTPTPCMITLFLVFRFCFVFGFWCRCGCWCWCRCFFRYHFTTSGYSRFSTSSPTPSMTTLFLAFTFCLFWFWCGYRCWCWLCWCMCLMQTSVCVGGFTFKITLFHPDTGFQ